MKTSELTGALLDYWVARAEGLNPAEVKGFNRPCYAVDNGNGFEVPNYSTSWAQGGPIIERERIHTCPLSKHQLLGEHAGQWTASKQADWPRRSVMQYGPTPLVAAMRAYVASKFGDEVPDELSGSSPVGADKE